MPSLTEKRAALRARLQGLIPLEDDPHPNSRGVLLSDEIIFYARHGMIYPFDPGNLKPAGYELTVGDEYFLSGEFLELGADENNKVTIPPFEVAVIKTGEILCLPRFVIARWNIRVKHAYSGLLWVGGPQVDPGYVGHLFCPIYNLSDKPVTLHLGDPLALMDFVKTTAFDKDKPEDELKRYPLPPKRLILEDYGIDDLRSALFTRAGERLDEFAEAVKNLETRFVTFTQISFGVFALIMATLAIASRAGAADVLLSASLWGALTVGASVSALLVAIFSYVQWRVGRLVRERYGIIMANRARHAQRFIRKSWWIAVSLALLFSIGGGVLVYRISEPFFRDLRQQRVLTRSDLDSLKVEASARLKELQDRLDQIDAKRLARGEEIDNLRRDLVRRIEGLRALPATGGQSK